MYNVQVPTSRWLVLLVLVSLVLAAAPATADTGSSSKCSIPCGYIYPLITIEPHDDQDVRDLPRSGNVTVDATLTWKFDMDQEGFTLNDPTKPIEIVFEFPRKPAWAGMSVEPSKIEVPISPQYVEPETDDPSEPGATYRYTHDITITLGQRSQAVLPPGEDTTKLLVFAKSSESGLYKPSYGIKQLAVQPEDPIHRAEEGSAVDAVEPAPQPLETIQRSLGPVDLTLEAEQDARYFRPTPLTARVTTPDGESVGPARLSLSLIDEEGQVLYATGPRHAEAGVLHTNLTLPEPGQYRVAVTAEPTAQTEVRWQPASLALPLHTGPTDQGPVELEPQYQATYTELVTEVSGESDDPAGQYEKFIPFPVYEDANGASFAFFLGTDTPATRGPTGTANLNVAILDPTGAVLAQGTFDPANPTLRMPVGGLPGPGLYQIHVYGAGANPDALAGATYDVEMSVSYDGTPIVKDIRDGVFAMPGSTHHADVGITLQHEHLTPWTPTTLEVPITDGNGTPLEDDVDVILTVTDADGNLVHTTGRTTATGGTVTANITYPGVGPFFVTVVPEAQAAGERHWQPTALTSTVHVGGHDTPRITLPDTFHAAYEATVDAGSTEDVRTYPVPVLTAATEVSATLTAGSTAGATYHVSLVGPDGEVVQESQAQAGGTATVSAGTPDDGLYQVLVTVDAPFGGAYDIALETPYPQPITVDNPLFPVGASGSGDGTGSGDGPLQNVPLSPALALLALMGVAWLHRRDP